MPRASKRCPLCRGPRTLLKGSPVKVLGGTARALGRLLRRSPSTLLARRPRPGEWSAVEVLAHLADVEVASAFRILRSLAPAQRRRVGVHSECGPIRLDQLVAHLAEHDLNHLNQLRQNLRSLAPRR